MKQPAKAKQPDPVWPADKVERMPIAEIQKYDRNARVHTGEQVSQIAQSIRQWGFTVPILVDEQMEIIAGHGRYEAAIELELEEVPVMVARGWSPRQIKAYRIADNKLALNSAWDVRLLAAELDGLAEMGSLIGFSEDELADLLKIDSPPDEFPESDENIDTEHECPRCGFRWSGNAAPGEDEEA
jgi:ParB-like chromosome segregation protein Spo0J